MKKFILKWIYRITAINNRKVLLRVANLPANGTVRITKDEERSDAKSNAPAEEKPQQ